MFVKLGGEVIAEVAEWLKVLVSKTSGGNPIREFESHPLRQTFLFKEKLWWKTNFKNIISFQKNKFKYLFAYLVLFHKYIT